MTYGAEDGEAIGALSMPRIRGPKKPTSSFSRDFSFCSNHSYFCLLTFLVVYLLSRIDFLIPKLSNRKALACATEILKKLFAFCFLLTIFLIRRRHTKPNLV